jgi:hypothetical protein
MMKSQGAYS